MIETIFHWMQQLYEALGSTAQISLWVYLLVAAGGVASGISPCFVPVLTMFGGYVGGYARADGSGGLRLALPFVAGNVVTLAVAGAAASFLGKSSLRIFTGYELDRWIPGIVGLLMAFQLLGILRLKLPAPAVYRWTQKRPGSAGASFLLGLPFGLVVTPCTIPIFLAIVAFVALQATALHGALLMAAYALGRGTVLLAIAITVGLLKALDVARTSFFIERVSGIIILVASLGLLLFYRDFVGFTMQWMMMPK